MCSRAEKYKQFFSVMYFASQRPTFNLRPNLEVKEYCDGQN